MCVSASDCLTALSSLFLANLQAIQLWADSKVSLDRMERFLNEKVNKHLATGGIVI